MKSNRSAIGAQLRLTSGKRVQVDEVRSGGSYISQNDLRIHFGLGEATQADTLQIRWPSGETETLQNLPAGHLITIEEGKGVVSQQAMGRKAKE